MTSRLLNSKYLFLFIIFFIILFCQGCFEGTSKSGYFIGELKNGKNLEIDKYFTNSFLTNSDFFDSFSASVRFSKNDSVIERFSDNSIKNGFDFKLMQLNDSVAVINYKDSTSKNIASASKKILLKNKYGKGKDF